MKIRRSRRGFTLIELLVVVLILGILTAVALPQYRKVVEKFHATQALVLLKTIGKAFDAYWLEHGQMPNSFSELDVSLPAGWTDTDSAFSTSSYKDAHSNSEWGIIFQAHAKWNLIFASRLKGPYRGVGFVWLVKPNENLKAGRIYCAETTESGKYPFKGPPGAFCTEFFNGTLTNTGGLRLYTMP